jgi:fatty-acyl-CoA synthase
VLREGATTTPDDLRAHLGSQFAKWQIPDAWAFIDQVPRTSVGKFDKKVVRRAFADGEYTVRRTTD